MPYSPSGTFTPLVTFIDGTPATAEDQNSQDADISSGLTAAMTRAGLAPATAPLSMGGFRLTNVGAATLSGDAINLGYLGSYTFSFSQVVNAIGYTPANKAGDTFTGGVTIAPVGGNGTLILEKTAISGQSVNVYGSLGAALRWGISLGDGTTETGSNVGSNFDISSFTDAGSPIAIVLSIVRSTGAATFTGALTVNGATSLTTATATTPSVNDNSTNVATTAWVTTNAGETTAGIAFTAIGDICAGTLSGTPTINAGATFAGNLFTINGTGGGTSFTPGAGTTWRFLGTWGAGPIYILAKRLT